MRPAPPTDGYSPGVTTSIVFDTPDYALCQDAWWKSLQDLEITGNAIRSGTANVHWISGIGFQLETIHDQSQSVHEEDAGVLLRHGIETGKPKYQPAPLKSVPLLAGVPTGTQVEGDQFNQKQQAAADDWDNASYSLAADLASFPSPSDTEIVPLDRVYVGSSPMNPDDTLWMRFWVPQLGGGASIGAIGRLYFTGLSSSPNGEAEGNGSYCLTLRGDGRAFLWEQVVADGAWTLRKQFSWSPQHQVSGAWHIIAIRSDAFFNDLNGLWQGSVINIQCQATQDYGQAYIAVVAGLAIGGNTTQYYVPQTKPQHITLTPVRLDIRRNVRLKVSLSYSKFAESGTLQGQTVNNPREMGAVGGLDPVICVRCSGTFPTGTTFAIALYGADGTPCAVSGPAGANATQVYKSFTRIDAQQEYYPVFTFGSSAGGADSPVLKRVDFIRDGAIGLGASTPWTLPAQSATDYSIFGAGTDPTVETASIGLISLQDGFAVATNGVLDPMHSLTERSGQSCRIEFAGLPSVTVNGHAQTTSVSFLGKVASLKRRRIGVKRWKAGGLTAQDFPSRTWWQGKLILNGMWKRFLQAKTTSTMYDLGGIDHDTGTLYTITKIARLVLSNAGIPSKMLDITDLPITLQADLNDKNKSFQLEVHSEAFSWVMNLLHDYLGAALVIDPNATNGGLSTDKSGCVRMKLPPRPVAGEYLPLAQFVDDATWTSGLKAKMNLRSYAPYTRSDGHDIPVSPVIGLSIEDRDEPPEGNCVYVAGATATQSGGTLQVAAANEQLWAILHNWPAAQFFDDQPIACDPTHSDYTDGTPNLIVIIDPSLNTQAAINFAARRAFDFGCHRRKYKTIEALTVMVVDPLDTKQIRPRQLAWGDCVIYNGEYWFVSHPILDVNGESGGTRNGSTVYELFQIPALQGVDDGKDTVYQDFSLYAPIASQAA